MSAPTAARLAPERMQNTRHIRGRSASELAQSTTVRAVNLITQAAPAAAKWVCANKVVCAIEKDEGESLRRGPPAPERTY